MANQTGRPIAPARKLVAAVAGTIAVFVVALGFGMSSLGVVIFGVALLGLAVALGVVNVVRRGARAWVAGTAEVRSITPPPASTSVYGRARIQAVIVAPGLPTSEVEINESRIPVVKWPEPGDTLPITVDVDDMRRVRINWDDAPPRERGGDPPPPPPDFDDEPDADLDADLLGDLEPPPWTSRDRSWSRDDGDPPPPPPPGSSPPPPGQAPSPGGGSSRLDSSLDSEEYSESPVVVRDTPAGPIVEGEFVDHDDNPSPLPRRAAASPGFASAEPSDGPEPSAPPGPDPDNSGNATTEPNRSGYTAGEPERPEYATTEPNRPGYSATEPDRPEYTTAEPDRPGYSTAGPSPASATTVGAAAAAGAAVGAAAGAAAAGRPPGRRPSPRARSGAATATAEHRAPSAPPSPREPHPDDGLLTDIPLDDPAPPHGRGSSPVPPRSAPTAAPSGPAAPAGPSGPSGPAAPSDPASPGDTPSPYQRPEPTATSTPPSPAQVGSFPTAPEPSTPPPTAPPPSSARPAAPAASSPLPPPDDEIDLPLEGDPDPAPESTPAAARAMDEGLIAPPVDDDTAHIRPSTRFITNAAHDAAVPQPSMSEPADAPAPRPRPRPHADPAEYGRPRPEPTEYGSARLEPVASGPTEYGPGRPAPDDEPTQPLTDPARTQAAAPPEPAQKPQPAQKSGPSQEPEPSQRSGAAPEPEPAQEPGQAQEPEPEKHTGRFATAVGAVAAAAAAAAAAVRKTGKADHDDPRSTPPDDEETAPIPAHADPPADPGRADPQARDPRTTTPAEGTGAASTGVPTDTTADAPRPHGAAPTAEAAPFFESSLLDEEDTTRLPTPGAATSAPSGAAAASAAGAAASAAAGAGFAAARGTPTTPGDTGTPPAPDDRGEPQHPGGNQPKPSPAAAALAAAAAAAAAQDRERNRGPWADLAGAREPDDSTADVITAYPSARPGPAGAIYGVGITVLVTDLARSTAFYRDTLGFFEIDGGDGSAVLASGDTRLVLRTVHDLSAGAGHLIFLNLEVGDVEAVYQELMAKGVEFVHPPQPVNRGDRLELWSAAFHDPDGHNIAITQWRAIR